MSNATQIIDRNEAMLTDLAELELSLARHVHAQLIAATDAEAIDTLGRTYQQIVRSRRQTLALKARLGRERRKAPVEDRAEAEREALAVAGSAAKGWPPTPTPRKLHDWRSTI